MNKEGSLIILSIQVMAMARTATEIVNGVMNFS